MENKKFEQTISGSNEQSIAAGILCIICKTNNLKITPEKIANEFKISENTVRNQAKKIADNIRCRTGQIKEKNCD